MTLTTRAYDGFTEYGRGKDVDTLWRLVLKVPEYISDILIKSLPPGAGLSSGIPEDVLSGMSDGQLTTLFNREDIDLKELRKKVFFEAGEKRDEIKGAAIRYNFDLDYSEFGKILHLPKSEAGRILYDLTWAHNLSLCLYQAIHDVSLQTDRFDALDAEFAAKALDRRLQELTGWERKKQLRDLNLYRLARQAVPWKKGEDRYLPSGELEFLSKAVVEGDTWGTFVAYSNVRAENSSNSRKLEEYLNQFDDPAKDEAGRVDDESQGEHTELLDRIEKLLETVSTRTREREETQTELGNSPAGVTRLQATQDRQTLLLYVVIGLLVWLLIKIF